ncbi:MAG: hypothetical protein WDO74_29325 [Pseudomonadota bacterium]
MNRSTRIRSESADPFAMQLALSRVHARLVPMQRGEQGYALDPSAEGWIELTADRGFAGFGLSRALRMLLDVLRGLTALHDTFDAEGVTFAHGEVALTQLRVDNEGVCRLVPLTARHSSAGESTPPDEALGHLAPERLLGETVDARSDVFSAGVLLWEALAGRRLFNETSADAIVDRLMGEKLPIPQLPPELAWAIPLKSIAVRALAVDPYQRFADCAELATAIAIVARERVATHAEIAAFFGSKVRSINSVAQQRPRPIPTRSSTFPSVRLPVSPVGVSAPPSSRNGFPLATPAPRSVTPAPAASGRAPESLPSATHKSPFTTLLGTGESVPASHRRKTLTAVGTPLSALGPVEAAPVSASVPRSASMSTPPLPLWAASMPFVPAPLSQAPTSSSAVVVRTTLESIPLSADEVATFRRRSPPRSLILLALLAVAGVVTLIAIGSGGEAADTAANRGLDHAQAVAPRTPLPEQPAAISDAPTRPAAVPPSGADVSHGTPASTPKEFRPASKAASPSRPASASGTKDYGI